MNRVHPKSFAEIRWADVSFLSLCIGGRTNIRGLYKSKDKENHPGFYVGPLFKAQDNFEEKGQLATVIYPANLPDTDGEWASPEVVQHMAHGALKKGIEIDIHHNFEPVGSDKAYLAESFILQGEDPRFDGLEYGDRVLKSKDLQGSWVGIVQIDDPDLRKAYREEGWNGVSIGSPNPYLVRPDSTPPAVLEKALTMDEVRTNFSSALRSVMRRRDALQPESLRDLSLNITIPRLGERDFEGNLRRPMVHMHLSAELQQ